MNYIGGIPFQDYYIYALHQGEWRQPPDGICHPERSEGSQTLASRVKDFSLAIGMTVSHPERSEASQALASRARDSSHTVGMTVGHWSSVTHCRQSAYSNPTKLTTSSTGRRRETTSFAEKSSAG